MLKEIKNKIETNGRAFLVGLTVVVFLVTLIFFTLKLLSKPIVTSPEEVKSLDIPLSILDGNDFKDLKIFEASKLPEDWGRPKPFEAK